MNIGSAMSGLGSLGGRMRDYVKRGIGGGGVYQLPKPIKQPTPGVYFPSHMPKGSSLTPAGDIGERRQRESVAVGGFKDGKTISASGIFNTFKGGK